MFKIRLAFLQALNSVAERFGGNEGVEAALWALMKLAHCTALEKMIIVESMLKRDRDEIINSVKEKEPKCHQE